MMLSDPRSGVSAGRMIDDVAAIPEDVLFRQYRWIMLYDLERSVGDPALLLLLRRLRKLR